MTAFVENPTDMLIFARVAKTMSFTRAAQDLAVSRSVVSKHITQLEDRLGVRLLNRTTRRLSLTEAGDIFYGYCREVVTSVDDATAAIKAMQSQPSGELKISMSLILGQLLTPAMVQQLLACYPALSINLELTNDYVDLVGEGYDAAVRIGILSDSSLVARKVGSTKLIVCATPTYFGANGVPTSPDELSEHDCIILTTLGSGIPYWRFQGANGAVSVKVMSRMQTNSDAAIHKAVLAGHGIAYVPEFMVGVDIAAGRLQVILQDYCQQQRGIYVLYPNHKNLPLKVRAFVDFVSDNIGRAEMFAS